MKPAVGVALGRVNFPFLHHRAFLRRGFRLKSEVRDRTLARNGPHSRLHTRNWRRQRTTIMKLIFGIGAILIGIWQVYVSKQYFNNLKKQSSPLIFALIATIASLAFAAVLLVYGVQTLISLR